MSTSDQTFPAEVTYIPLLRRISEIMEEKGETIRGLSNRLSMSRETLRLRKGEILNSPKNMRIAHINT